jgi:tryptophan synthase alpha chain
MSAPAGRPEAAASAGAPGNAKLARAFEAAAADNRAALIGYLPAGFPTVAGAIAAATAMAQAGVDIVEIGLPYSDPLLDGPVIQEAGQRALAAGTTGGDVFATVQAVAEAGVPVLIMTYWNPVERFGVRAFARDLSNSGGSGLITPDLTPEEAGPWLEAAAELSLDPVFLVAPSSSAGRIKLITSACRGFVYAASLMGTTGVRNAVSGDAAGLVRRVKLCTTLPVCVGLGIRDRAQAAEVAGFADGVIVGSAFVRCLLEAPDEKAGIAAVRNLAGDLVAGVREGHG